MKFLDEDSGKVLIVQNEVLFDLRNRFRIVRNFFFDFLNMDVPCTINGELCLVHFDFVDDVCDKIYNVDTSDLEDFAKQLFISHVSHLNLRLCEEEDLDVDGVDFKQRQYLIRKTLKIISYAKKKKS